MRRPRRHLRDHLRVRVWGCRWLPSSLSSLPRKSSSRFWQREEAGICTRQSWIRWHKWRTHRKSQRGSMLSASRRMAPGMPSTKTLLTSMSVACHSISPKETFSPSLHSSSSPPLLLSSFETFLKLLASLVPTDEVHQEGCRGSGFVSASLGCFR